MTAAYPKDHKASGGQGTAAFAFGRGEFCRGPRESKAEVCDGRRPPLQRFSFSSLSKNEKEEESKNELQAPYRSHSPITKSTDPRIVTTSLTMWPGRIFGRMLRFTKLGERIFMRYGTPPPLL
jgi:hypothetical protein